MIEWSRQPGLLPRIPSGADREKPWSAISDDVLAILARDRDIDVRFSAEAEMARRSGQPEVAPSPPTQQTLI